MSDVRDSAEPKIKALVKKHFGRSKKKKKKTDVLKMDNKERFAFYVNDRTPWAIQKTVIPFWPSDIVRNLTRWFLFWLLWWGFSVKRRIGKSLATFVKRVLVLTLLFHTYTKRMAR